MVSSQARFFFSSNSSYLLPLYLGTALISAYAVVSLPLSSCLLVLSLVGLVAVAETVKPDWGLFYLIVFMVLVTPPLFPAALGGEVPVHISSILLLALVVMALLRLELFKLRWDSVGETWLCLLITMALSLPFAYWLSGLQVGLQSSLRFVLVLQPWFLYVWICSRDFNVTTEQLSRFVKFLLVAGALAAAYGIIDFYAPFPFSHPFADQYIYLQGAMIRRAQGAFYEASSFGNLCGFLLSLSLLHFYGIQRKTSLWAWAGLLVLVGVFFTGLFLAYSRGSWVNFLVTAGVFLICQGTLRLSRLVTLVGLLIALAFLLHQISPAIVANFFEWRLANLLEFWNDPSFATSGRWETWAHLLSYFADHPWLLVFGIGYKALPYTDLFGASLIADNGFLSLAFEIGIVGLVTFLSLNWAIFRLLYQTAQQQNSTVRRYATFMFAFWCGEMVQMLTADLFTYWRNLIIYFTMMAFLQQVYRQERTPGQI